MRYKNFKYEIGPSRWAAFKKYLYSQEEYLMNWAVAKGLVTIETINTNMRSMKESDYEKFKNTLLTEVYSRTCGVKILAKKYGYKPSEIKHMPLYCEYDFETLDGKKYECKFRFCDNDQYDTDKIDKAKMVSTTTGYDDEIILLYTFWDGTYRAYNINDFCGEGDWGKRSQSVSYYYNNNNDTKYVTQPYVEYDPKSFLWSGTTTIPTITLVYN